VEIYGAVADTQGSQMCTALFQMCRTLWRKYQALLRIYRALFVPDLARSSSADLSFSNASSFLSVGMHRALVVGFFAPFLIHGASWFVLSAQTCTNAVCVCVCVCVRV